MAAIEPFADLYGDALAARMAAKLGFGRATPAVGALADALLALLARERTDYTIFWRRLARQMAGTGGEPVRDLFIDRAAWDAWLLQYQSLSGMIHPGTAPI
jgi:uncharacterized protein YdiU (UPF0061 family)